MMNNVPLPSGKLDAEEANTERVAWLITCTLFTSIPNPRKSEVISPKVVADVVIVCAAPPLVA